jgi:hypothetical protein
VGRAFDNFCAFAKVSNTNLDPHKPMTLLFAVLPTGEGGETDIVPLQFDSQMKEIESGGELWVEVEGEGRDLDSGKLF